MSYDPGLALFIGGVVFWVIVLYVTFKFHIPRTNLVKDVPYPSDAKWNPPRRSRFKLSTSQVPINQVISELFDEIFDLIGEVVDYAGIHQVSRRCPYIGDGGGRRLMNEINVITIDKLSKQSIRGFIELERRLNLSPSVSGYFAMVCWVNINDCLVDLSSDMMVKYSENLYDHAKYRFTLAMLSVIEELIINKSPLIVTTPEYKSYDIYVHRVKLNQIEQPNVSLVDHIDNDKLFMKSIDKIDFSRIFEYIDAIISISGVSTNTIVTELRKIFADPIPKVPLMSTRKRDKLRSKLSKAD